MRKLAGLLVVAAVLAVPAVSALGATPTQKANVVNFAFKPKKLSIKKGTKVTWSFKSAGIKHNVTAKSGPVKFHSAQQGQRDVLVHVQEDGHVPSDVHDPPVHDGDRHRQVARRSGRTWARAPDRAQAQTHRIERPRRSRRPRATAHTF